MLRWISAVTGGLTIEFPNASPTYSSLQLLFSAIITMSATSLIGLKIFLVTRQSHMRRSYLRVMEILVQSAVLVSIILWINCIFGLVSLKHPVHLGTSGDTVFYELGSYLNIIQPPLIVGFTCSSGRIELHTDVEHR